MITSKLPEADLKKSHAPVVAGKVTLGYSDPFIIWLPAYRKGVTDPLSTDAALWVVVIRMNLYTKRLILMEVHPQDKPCMVKKKNCAESTIFVFWQCESRAIVSDPHDEMQNLSGSQITRILSLVSLTPFDN